MRGKSIILWDLDGTLTDPEEGITKAVQHSLRAFGIEIPDRRRLYPFIGPPLKDSYMREFAFTQEEADLAIAKYREYFSVTGLYENIPYDGIEGLLHDLQKAGKTLLVATSKPTVFAARILEHFRLLPYFHGVYGSELDGTRVEKADVIRYALEQERITALSRCVMVGDRDYDVLGAHRNGLEAIGVTYGYGSREELIQAGAEAVAEDVNGLRQLLL